jgi:hypothetical protein
MTLYQWQRRQLRIGSSGLWIRKISNTRYKMVGQWRSLGHVPLAGCPELAETIPETKKRLHLSTTDSSWATRSPVLVDIARRCLFPPNPVSQLCHLCLKSCEQTH